MKIMFSKNKHLYNSGEAKENWRKIFLVSQGTGKDGAEPKYVNVWGLMHTDF